MYLFAQRYHLFLSAVAEYVFFSLPHHASAELGPGPQWNTTSCTTCLNENNIPFTNNICFTVDATFNEGCLPLYARLVGNCAKACPKTDNMNLWLNQHMNDLAIQVEKVINRSQSPKGLELVDLYLNPLKWYAEMIQNQTMIQKRIPNYQRDIEKKTLALNEALASSSLGSTPQTPNPNLAQPQLPNTHCTRSVGSCLQSLFGEEPKVASFPE